MEKERVEKLLKVASEQEKVTIGTLFNATLTTLKAYQSDNTAAKLKDWNAAEATLEKIVLELEGKYFQKKDPRLLSDRVEAWKFLQAEGFKVGRQTVYNAVSSGKLIMQPDGTIAESDALAYAAKNLKKIAGKNGKPDKVAEERAGEELALIRIKREKAELELAKERGLYVLKSDVRTEIAIKIAFLEASIKHMWRTFAADWIHRVGGNPQKTHMLLELVNAESDQFFNEIGRMEDINVIVVKAGAIDPDPAGDQDPEGGVFALDAAGDPEEDGDGIPGDA